MPLCVLINSFIYVHNAAERHLSRFYRQRYGDVFLFFCFLISRPQKKYK